MRVFVINLDRRPDRLAQVSEVLDHLGLSFERVSAVDGAQYDTSSATNTVAAYLFNGLRTSLPGEVGCFLSHRKVWEIIVSQNIEQALVLEDDVVNESFDPRILDVLEPITKMNIDLLRLAARPKSKLDQSKLHDTLLSRRVVRSWAWGSAAYIITREGAIKALRCRKYWFPVDHYPLWTKFYDLQTAVLVPTMLITRKSDSNIAVRGRRRSSWLVRRLFRPLLGLLERLDLR